MVYAYLLSRDEERDLDLDELSVLEYDQDLTGKKRIINTASKTASEELCHSSMITTVLKINKQIRENCTCLILSDTEVLCFFNLP